jgi:hypothetical protein
MVEGPEGEYRVDYSLVHPVMLEMDGYLWHFSPEHQSRDHERRNRLKLGGIDLYVSNWREICRGPPGLARVLQQAIRQLRSRTPGPL